MLMNTVPSTIQEWYSKAIYFQTQWEQAEEITKRNQCPTQHSYQSFNSNTSKAKDPNAMDVDVVHVGKLTPDERKCCIEKGLYFHCQKVGHLSRECPSFSNKKLNRQVKQVAKEKEIPNLHKVDNDNEETI